MSIPTPTAQRTETTRPAAYYRELLLRLAGPHVTFTEHDLDSLYDTPEPTGQRAWLLTLHDTPERALA